MFKSRAILRSALRSQLSEQTGFLFFSVAKGCTFSCLTLNFLFFYMLTLAGLKNPRSSTIALLGWGYTPSPFFQNCFFGLNVACCGVLARIFIFMIHVFLVLSIKYSDLDLINRVFDK